MIEAVDLNDATIIEPYWSCSLEEGITSLTELFTSRTVHSIQMFVQRIRPTMIARLNNTFPPRPSENFFQPIEDYKTLNGDGLISVCMKVHDQARRHEIAIYNHITEQLKRVGSIPRHRFKNSVDAYVTCMNDPQFVEGVIGAMTHDAKFVAIFAHSKNLRVVNVFNVETAACLFEKDLSCSTFFQDCQPTGLALIPTGVSKSEFDIAVLSYNMEVRVWNTADCMGRALQLEDANPSFSPSLYVINPRESFLRFSPDGRYLCVLAFVAGQTCVCIVMDTISLQPLHQMPYNFTYGPLCCIFPCFTVCGSRFVMFTPSEHYYELDKYQLHFFEIPQTLQSLKELCRLSILSAVDRSDFNKLPLPRDMILFLTSGNFQNLTSVAVTVAVNAQKKCHLM